MTDEIEEFNDEPNWIRISHLYADLAKASTTLSADITRYKSALNELDGAGTRISNGKDRIFLLRDQIAQLEAEAKK